MEKVRLCWLKDDIKNCVEFNSLDELQKVMNCHLPNGEWIEDMNGNKLDVKIQYAR